MALIHELALTFIPHIGDVTARALVGHFGSAEAVFSASATQLSAASGIRPTALEKILNHGSFAQAEKEMEFIEKFKIRALSITHQDYPRRLKSCYDAPFIIYYKGQADLNDQKVISIVGTRNATEYGKELCYKLMEDLRVHNPVIVSGLAHGIDSLAHKEALNHEMRTVGVLGHGLDRIYPAQNRALAEKMLHHGGLLTEFPSGSNPDKENFPKRNRIIAGLSDVTLVVEASIKGGALITAELANSYNRDVFAFPGRIDSPFSEGCNHLIKTNRANLIVGVKDLEYILNWNVESPPPETKQLSLLMNLSAEEQKVADLLQHNGAMGIDDLSLQSEFPQSKLAITILGMEMQGLVLALPGKMYKLA